MTAVDVEPILSVQDLKVHFETPRGVVKAVDGVNFAIRPGETLGLVGESGCGKSTVARSIVGLVPTTDGTVTLEGAEIQDLDNASMRPCAPSCRWSSRIPTRA